MVIVLPNHADLYQKENYNNLNLWAFKRKITYRRYSFDLDNMTGDLIKTDYYDYEIVAELQPGNLLYSLSSVGQIINETAYLYIQREINNYEQLPYRFRPQLNDEVMCDNIWYRINTINAKIIGESEVGFECELKRIKNENEVGWI
jgi:hypothetical protein